MDTWHYWETITLLSKNLFDKLLICFFSYLSPSAVQFLPPLRSSVHFRYQQWHNPQIFRFRWPLLPRQRARDAEKHFPGGWMVLITRVDDEGYGSCCATAE